MKEEYLKLYQRLENKYPEMLSVNKYLHKEIKFADIRNPIFSDEKDAKRIRREWNRKVSEANDLFKKVSEEEVKDIENPMKFKLEYEEKNLLYIIIDFITDIFMITS